MYCVISYRYFKFYGGPEPQTNVRLFFLSHLLIYTFIYFIIIIIMIIIFTKVHPGTPVPDLNIYFETIHAGVVLNARAWV